MYEHGGRQYLLVTAVDTPWPDGVQAHIGPTGLIAYALPQRR
jgi:hypothetical protein